MFGHYNVHKFSSNNCHAGTLATRVQAERHILFAAEVLLVSAVVCARTNDMFNATCN